MKRAMETYEPEQPLPGWPESHVHSELTDMDHLECVKVTIHGVDHYLHASTAKELRKSVERTLKRYNKECRKYGVPGV